MSVPARRWALVLLLLVATALRVVGLDNFPTPKGGTPPGLEHDEVAHWIINQGILEGRHAIYFIEAYGHEALYHYAQAAVGALLGDHAFALRLPSAFLGVLLVAVSYALGRRLFGWRMGLLSAAFLTVHLWPVFYSRLALRAIALPVVSGLSAVAWWAAWRGGKLRGYVVAGVLAGLSLHTYMAGRAVPIFYGLYTLYLATVHREAWRARWRGVAVFWLALVAAALPLIAFLVANPGAEVRIGEVDGPLRALLAGDLRPVMANAGRIAVGFIVRGDPLWRQYVAGRPVFEPVVGVLFFAGVAVCLWRWRRPRYAFLLLWLAASLLPSLVTVDAPSTIRMINLLPVLMLFPLLGGQRLLQWVRTRIRPSVKPKEAELIPTSPHLSTVWTSLSTDLTTALVHGALLLLWLYYGWATFDALWRQWPAEPEVQFVWQAALTEAGAYLDASADAGPVAIGGWTPDTMDPPTMQLTLRRDDLVLGFFDPTQSLLLPDPGGGAALLARPAILPLAPELEPLTGPWTTLPEHALPGRQFAVYRYETPPELQPAVPADAVFGGELRLLGYDPAPSCADPVAPCTLVTYWRVLAPPAAPRRLFFHIVTPDGQPIAQDDRLGAPAEHWREGDTIVQLLTVPQSGGEWRLGVYDPATGQRLPLPHGTDSLTLDSPHN